MTIHAIPIETRSEGDDPIAAMTGAVDELRTGFETFRTSTDQRLTTELRGLADRLGAIETRMNRPNPGNPGNPDADLERRAFLNFCRTGVERMNTDEVRALTVSTDTQGGYLVPPGFLTELQRNLVLLSPMRRLARVTPVSSPTVVLPVRTGTLTTTWGTETTPSTGTQPAYGQLPFSVHEMKCFVDLSNQLLEDSVFNMEAELAADIAEDFGRSEGAAFVNGDGISKPLGLLKTPDITTLTSNNATDLVANDVIDLFHSLPSFYASRATWIMNRGTIGALRKIHNTTGELMWTPESQSLADGNPGLLLGRPVVEMPDMPDAAPGALPVAFGDFGSGFRIFDRVNLSVLRDPYSQQVNGLVRFHARRRVGGGVNKTEALRFLKIKAA